MRKKRSRTTRCTVALAFSFTLAAWAGAAQAIQFPNDLFIPATGCSNPPSASTYTGLTGCAGAIPCTGTFACPGYLDTKFEVIAPLNAGTGKAAPATTNDPKAVYRYIGATDGAAIMADGSAQYIFGFLDLTRVPLSYITGTVPAASAAATYAGTVGGATVGPVPITETNVFPNNLLPPAEMVSGDVTYQGKAQWPAPDLIFNEGDHVYLNLINFGMRERMDLPDAHTVHWHGKDQAAPIFDGEPMASYGINMSLTPAPVASTGMPGTPEARDLTYFYNANHPGTYLYHCHVEATEHMEMGMLGHLIVRPAQNGTSHSFNGKAYTTFAYNDCTAGLAATLCGATGYDVEMLLMLADFDPAIHAWDSTFGNPAPNFGIFTPGYPMMNGRGYPDTIRPNNDPTLLNNMPALAFNGTTQPAGVDYVSQTKSSLITIPTAQRSALIRLTNLSIFSSISLRSELPFRVVGKDASLLAGPTGTDLTYAATDVLIGPGETYDLIVDAGTGASRVPGTYFLYARQLYHLNNNGMDRGGLMTEIVVQ